LPWDRTSYQNIASGKILDNIIHKKRTRVKDAFEPGDPGTVLNFLALGEGRFSTSWKQFQEGQFSTIHRRGQFSISGDFQRTTPRLKAQNSKNCPPGPVLRTENEELSPGLVLRVENEELSPKLFEDR